MTLIPPRNNLGSGRMLRRWPLLAWSVLPLGCTGSDQYQPPDPPIVSVAQPVRQTITDFLEETGTTEAVQKVEIRARVRGFLEEMRFEPGKEVNQGDVLYVIQPQEYRAKAEAARAVVKSEEVELRRAEIEYQRQQRLLAENATAETSVVQAEAERDAAEAALDAAKAALDQAQLELQYTEVTTPISGRVGKTLVKVGNLVGDGESTHLTTVVKYDPIYVNFNISERALLALMESTPDTGQGQRDVQSVKVYLRRATDSDFPFEGHLDYADVAVDQSTGTFLVRGVIPNPERRIIPGLFVRVRIPVGKTENAVLIPERAIGADQAGRYVLAVNLQNRVERHNIRLGVRHKDLVVVDDGLKGDEWIIVDGVQRSRVGAEVTAEKTTLPPPSGDLETVQQEQPASGAGPSPDPARDTDGAAGDTGPPSP